jgi:hypothetical protein
MPTQSEYQISVVGEAMATVMCFGSLPSVHLVYASVVEPNFKLARCNDRRVQLQNWNPAASQSLVRNIWDQTRKAFRLETMVRPCASPLAPSHDP